ncbi:hypothetical protein MVUOKPPV_CDS0281 [Klebsiella phage phi1_175008]|uniref:Uncharacterized protein n=1 Tax=Klebsiella phage phi1_175008 TaxID=3127744 RepID=A0ACD5FRW3_9CAUD
MECKENKMKHRSTYLTKRYSLDHKLGYYGRNKK